MHWGIALFWTGVALVIGVPTGWFFTSYLLQRYALRMARAAGWQCVFSDSMHSRGICRFTDYREMVQDGKPPIQQEPWQRQFVFVSRSYAFAMRPEWELPVHVGNWEGYNLFVSILLENITGVKYGKLWWSTREKLQKMLLHEVHDLFVPFAAELKGFGSKEQFEFFNSDKWSKLECHSYLTYGTTCFEQGK